MSEAMTSQLTQQSLRASCDRCRAKKVCCTIYRAGKSRSEVQKCVRCVRAKVECVFSRRAQTRKTTHARAVGGGISQRQQSCKSDAGTSTEASLPSSSDSIAMDISSLSSAGDQCALMLGSSDQVLHGDIDPFFTDDGFTNLLDISSFHPIPENGDKGPAFLHLFSEPYSPCKNTPSTTSAQDSASSFVHLSSLVAEIHEAVVLLSGDSYNPSLEASEDNLDTYAISPILNLTRRFTAVLRRSQSPRVCHAAQPPFQSTSATSSSASFFPATPISADGPNSNRPPTTLQDCLDQSPITPDIPDVATNLLVLTCYASLAKLYLTALFQMHQRLNRVPDPASLHAPSRGPGEVESFLDKSCSSLYETYSTMFTAVQILLDEFQLVEDLIDPPPLHSDLSISPIRMR
ncbi:uncharacterized protein N7483_002129 [Penicillium malachiteum]|uniref:uncharacterized protein n=1 Tax=Penicillium malachiteum TaxID=1324776 RepID=UPI00254784A9|nr:uncharacterized protein N7483_002129 [Penicillium malachiteum]KAJ5737004.1 hypothetical protein N7483_002129 [Penicillium malachiteum]